MSDTPEKPAKKPRKKAPPKLETENQAQRSDDDLREAVLNAALPHAAFDGFTDMVLQKAGAGAGLEKADVTRLFEDDPISLVEYFSTRTDAEMEKRLAAMDLKGMKIRERIATAVKTRLAILKHNLEPLPEMLAELDLDELARVSDGFTGADLKRLGDDGKNLFAHDLARSLTPRPVTEYFLDAIATLRQNKERYHEAETRAREQRPVRPVYFDVGDGEG